VKSFQVGAHLVQLSKREDRWAVAVDERTLSTWYLTQADAWEAGVREADRLDRSTGRAA
jgi:hypothetical protein